MALLISLISLMVILIVVVWVLPDFVGEVEVGQHQVPAAAKTAPPSETETQRARHKREAERALQGFLQRQAALEAQDVATWGGADYDQVLDILAAGDAAFANGDFELARTQYQTAQFMLNDLEASKPERLNRALQSGAEALARYDATAAVHAYEVALALAPDNEQARTGAARAATLSALAEIMQRASESERIGDWTAAKQHYEAAIALDSRAAEAQRGLQRAVTELNNQRFFKLMSTVLNAIQQGEFSAAREALSQAQELKPNTAEVADAKRRLDLAIQKARIAAHRKKAEELVAAERWHEAVQEFDAVLAIDPQTQFAVSGLSQSRQLAQLHDQLDVYLNNPERFQSAEPRENARELIKSVRSLEQRGSRLLEKLTRLETVLKLAETPVQIWLHSDGLTEVTIDRIGRFGSFEKTAVTLLPGTYTVRGSRTGYRDVRLKLSVAAGAAASTLTVKCEERI